MHLSYREWWALIHGIIFGAFFLLAFSGGLAGLWSLRTEWVTTEGLRDRVRRLKIGTVTMAWGALIRSSCKSTGFDPRLSLCTHARLPGATRATPLAIQRRPNGR
jgi:hypothetical protein